MQGNFGTTVDESRQEMYITEQRESAITVWKKSANGKDTALRLIQGDQTRLADPHGIAFDPKNRLLFVANYGTSHVVRKNPNVPTRILNWPGSPGGSEIVPGSGKFEPPSITVYSADIVGNMGPIRSITGKKTGLDRPTGVAFDAERQELYVADETAHTVSVFSATAQGDAAPLRQLKGPKTMMKIPSDVFLDLANREMWVASFGNHLALAYPLGASGDTAPTRIIRGSPQYTWRDDQQSVRGGVRHEAGGNPRHQLRRQSANRRVPAERRQERAAGTHDPGRELEDQPHDARDFL